MADILLTVGVDTSLSYAEFQAGITSLVSQVNANPPKIKLKFDDSSLSSMKKQIVFVLMLQTLEFVPVQVRTILRLEPIQAKEYSQLLKKKQEPVLLRAGVN